LFSSIVFMKAFHEPLHHIGGEIGSMFSSFKLVKKRPDSEIKLHEKELVLENNLLKEMITQLKEDQVADSLLGHQIERFVVMRNYLNSKPSTRESDLKQYTHDLGERIEMQMRFVRARVVFREPATWGSYFWIDRGRQTDEGVLQKYSPVVLGDDLVGMIDYVGEKKSRVRLITDSNLPVSVQVIRGSEQDSTLVKYLENTASLLEESGALNREKELKAEFLNSISRLRDRMAHVVSVEAGARGELFGSSFPLWRKKQPILQGVGFNCNHIKSRENLSALKMLQVGDLLVSTGLDGVFPRGFHVARVIKLKEIKEGSPVVDLQAVSSLVDLEELTHVQILPAIYSGVDYSAKTAF